MGKGHAVASAYIWISEGAPQPITAMKVGTGSWRRASGVMEAESVRRYCWQFWGVLVEAVAQDGERDVRRSRSVARISRARGVGRWGRCIGI